MSDEGGSLPDDWEMRLSRSTGMSYYYNMKTKDSQWDRPDPPTRSRRSRKVCCSHILVKHRESRRPSSWRQPTITRSKKEAMSLIKEYRRKILAQEAVFTDIATKYSDCSSARRAGDLGYFSRGQMQLPFEEESFKLKIGQLSQPIKTDSGIHIILRTA